jgi:hypothetical protein
MVFPGGTEETCEIRQAGWLPSMSSFVSGRLSYRSCNASDCTRIFSESLWLYNCISTIMLVCCIAYTIISCIGFHYCKDFKFISAAIFNVRAPSEKYLHVWKCGQLRWRRHLGMNHILYHTAWSCRIRAQRNGLHQEALEFMYNNFSLLRRYPPWNHNRITCHDQDSYKPISYHHSVRVITLNKLINLKFHAKNSYLSYLWNFIVRYKCIYFTFLTS